jgi:hypothetical protein
MHTKKLKDKQPHESIKLQANQKNKPAKMYLKKSRQTTIHTNKQANSKHTNIYRNQKD